jgi:hypothetical protein
MKRDLSKDDAVRNALRRLQAFRKWFDHTMPMTHPEITPGLAAEFRREKVKLMDAITFLEGR